MVLEVADGVGDGDARHIKQAMHEHQQEKRPKARHPHQREDSQSADKMTGGKKSLGCEMTICELVAEKHPYYGCQRKGVQNPRLLRGLKSKAGKITIDQR